MKRLFFGLLFLVSLHTSVTGQKKDSPYVVLVSFDGFRHDYIDKFKLSHFSDFIKNGSHADALIPCFPSKTFPNHYSIVTGLYPGNHGLVDNSFFDPARREKFSMANKKNATDSYYYGGTPLWILAQQQGIKSASYFWVGSETAFGDQYSDYYFPYEPSVKNSNRVNQVLQWLKLPQPERPHLITLYFSLIDDVGHAFGPGSSELRDKLFEADSLLGSLVNGIKKSNLPVNIIIVSDHGMEELTYRPDTYVYLNELVDLKDTAITVVNNGTHAHFYVRDKSKINNIIKALSQRPEVKAYQPKDFPDHWHYQNPRSGDLLITVPSGMELTLKTRDEIVATMKPGSRWGVHGYDPDEVKNMSGIFCAMGPNIKRGIFIPPFRNIHVYPFIAKILNLKMPAVIDGSTDVLTDVYQP